MLPGPTSAKAVRRTLMKLTPEVFQKLGIFKGAIYKNRHLNDIASG